MTHVLLPFFVLPLYAVMKRIPPDHDAGGAARSARRRRRHSGACISRRRCPAPAAGALIVFILALGYYITPALVGGAGDQMISYFIAFYTNQSLNWGMAAALSVLLLVHDLVLLVFCSRLSGRRELALR